MTDNESNIIDELLNEIKRAEIIYSEYNSPHEGYAVIKEELDELWDEIKKRDGNVEAMRIEAIQIACTAIRFVKMIERSRIKGVRREIDSIAK